MTQPRPLRGMVLAPLVMGGLSAPLAARAGQGWDVADRAARMIGWLDTDRDGRIRRAEAQSGWAARFARFDADGNGTVGPADLAAAHRARPGVAGRVAAALARSKRFAARDTNGDGLLTVAEFDRRAAARFARIDSDGDGHLSRAEIAAWRLADDHG